MMILSEPPLCWLTERTTTPAPSEVPNGAVLRVPDAVVIYPANRLVLGYPTAPIFVGELLDDAGNPVIVVADAYLQSGPHLRLDFSYWCDAAAPRLLAPLRARHPAERRCWDRRPTPMIPGSGRTPPHSAHSRSMPASLIPTIVSSSPPRMRSTVSVEQSAFGCTAWATLK